MITDKGREILGKLLTDALPEDLKEIYKIEIIIVDEEEGLYIDRSKMKQRLLPYHPDNHIRR
ncbi:MAG: hypothetical protein V3V19_11425 [Cocleimonas sp.]